MTDRLPRMRGDRPVTRVKRQRTLVATPHARGSTYLRYALICYSGGYPHARGFSKINCDKLTCHNISI